MMDALQVADANVTRPVTEDHSKANIAERAQ